MDDNLVLSSDFSKDPYFYKNHNAQMFILTGEEVDTLIKLYVKDKKSLTWLSNLKNWLPERGKAISNKRLRDILSFNNIPLRNKEENKQLSQINYKKACLEKYGVENPSSLPEIKEKRKQTMLQTYGVENPSQSAEIQKRKVETNIERFGVPWSTQSDNNKNKSKATLRQKYGVEYTSQIPGIEEVKKIHSLEKWGTEYPSQSQTLKDKKAQHNLDKYGASCTFQTKEAQRKSRETCQEKYGASWYAQTEEAKERYRTTCLEKYRVSNVSLCEDIKIRKIETCRKHFGVDHPMQASEIRHKGQKKWYFNNFSFDSLPELAFYVYNLDMGKNIAREPGKIRYEVGGVQHYYFPDFKIEDTLYEIKGDHFLDRNANLTADLPFTKGLTSGEKEKLQKQLDAKQECMKEHRVVLFRESSSEIKRCLAYLKEKYPDYRNRFRKKKGA